MDVIPWLGCSLILHARLSDARFPVFLGEYLGRSLEGATECFLLKKSTLMVNTNSVYLSTMDGLSFDIAMCSQISSVRVHG